MNLKKKKIKKLPFKFHLSFTKIRAHVSLRRFPIHNQAMTVIKDSLHVEMCPNHSVPEEDPVASVFKKDTWY